MTNKEKGEYEEEGGEGWKLNLSVPSKGNCDQRDKVSFSERCGYKTVSVPLWQSSSIQANKGLWIPIRNYLC